MRGRYTTVSQPESVDGWLAVQLGDKLWFPCWNSKVMEATAAKIIPIVAAQERTAAMQLPASPTGTSHIQPALVAAPGNGSASVTPASDSAADSVTNASAVSTRAAPSCSGGIATLCLAQKHDVSSLDYHTHSQTCMPSQLIPASAFFMAPLEQQVSELLKRVDELARSNAGAKFAPTVASQEHACAAAVQSSALVTPLQSWRRVQVLCDHNRLAQLLIPTVPRDCMAWLRH